MEETPKYPRSNTKIIIGILVTVILILIGVLVWCWWGHRDIPVPTSPGVAAESGPCADGASNPTPAGFTVYENTTLGYKFAYPTTWGTVSVTTTPIGSESGDYVMGRFSANEDVWFGGNSTDYIVNARDGIPTDLPGYLKASDRFYTVELWRFSDGSTITSRHDLHPIEEPYEEKAACNTTALVTNLPASELSDIGPADVARFNLKSTSRYYGVNIVMKHPTDASREDLNKIIRSFQLL